MNELFTGIYTLFDTVNDFNTAVDGQLYLHEARTVPPAVYPYAVYSLITGINDWTFTEETEELMIQFSIFSANSSATEAGEIYTKMKALFDDALLTVTGFDHVFMHREASRLLRDEAANTWHYSADYRILLEKAR